MKSNETAHAAWKKVRDAFGEVQGWSCQENRIQTPGWCVPWTLLHEISRGFGFEPFMGGRFLIELRSVEDEQKIEMLIELARAFERHHAPAFMIVPFDADEKHLLKA